MCNIAIGDAQLVWNAVQINILGGLYRGKQSNDNDRREESYKFSNEL